MKYASVRIIEASSEADAIEKVLNEEFEESSDLCDVVKPLEAIRSTLSLIDGHWTTFEYHPCKIYLVNGSEVVEQITDDEKPDFWTVYVRLTRGGLCSVADFLSEKECKHFIKALRALFGLYVNGTA